MSNMYRQCTFTRDNSTTTAWVPETGIKPGVRVRFEGEEGGDWWTVKEVGQVRLNEKYVKEQERAHLRQRAASDI